MASHQGQKKSSKKSRTEYSPKKQRSGGCFYLLFVTIAAATLIVFNTAIVDALLSHYTTEESRFYTFLSNEKVRQTLLFVFPVFMVLMEYWVYDLLVDRANSIEEAEERIRDLKDQAETT